MKKGSRKPRPFFCKKCQDPITRERVLSHGLCYNCYLNEQNRKYREKHPEKVRETVRRSWRKRKDKGFSAMGNYISVVVCEGCGGHIKGRYGSIGTIVANNRAVKCPHCSYLHKKGDQIRVIRVKRATKYRDTIPTFNQWNVYKHVSDVKEHLESLPEKIETTEELRKRVKVRPLTREAFVDFDKRRDKIIVRRAKNKPKRMTRIENRIAKSLRYYGEWLTWETRLTPSS